MNYVILNGVKSNTVKGLLIQSLPPISKPLIRTQIEQIDGRDGDIVTKLGYAAYDKQMSIGLYGDYNVDDVIRFFDSQGTVIFSNEPDKYYNYEIIQQIDFERLIRFKTATVVFHVQPFKFSASDRIFTLNNQFFHFNDYSQGKNGVILSAIGGNITISGTATAATEFYLPINPAVLGVGDFTLRATASGTGANLCSVRLIGSVPSNADSFGGNYLALQNNASVTLSAAQTASKTYNYLWFYINAGTMDYSLDVVVRNDDIDSITVMNRGNTTSRPKITIYGNGTINLSVNGVQLFVIDMDSNEYITLDAQEMNAYMGDTLLNRYVQGDYSNLVLNVGTNTISWTGIVDSIEVEDFTRWI